MGNSTNQLAEATTQQDIALAGKEFALGNEALTSGTKYLTTEYNAGGTSILDPKFRAMGTDALEASGASTGNMQDVGSILQARALGQSGVANQKLTAGLDEINKLRGLLSSHGLQTTGLGVAGQGESLQALSLMPKNPTLSAVNAGLGGAAAVYGGLNKPGAPGGAPQTQTIAPISQSSFGAASGIADPDSTLGVGSSSFFSRPSNG